MDGQPRIQILLCDGPSCGVTHESERLREHLERRIAGDPQLAGRVHVVDFTCFGRCGEGPNLFVRAVAEAEDPREEPDPERLEAVRGFYPGMDEARCDRVLAGHCRGGAPVEDLVDDY